MDGLDGNHLGTTMPLVALALVEGMNAMSTESATGTTLHFLLSAPDNHDAWRLFVDRYGTKILFWCRRWGLQEADAENVTQEVLAKLARKLTAYDPSKGRFRGWLKTLAHHAWQDYVEAQRRPGAGSGDTKVLDKLNSVEARDDLANELALEFDAELWQEAQARVRLRVAENTWEAFRRTAIDGLSGAEVAAQLQMKVAAVFVARGRVRKLLQAEIRKLDGEATE